MTKTTIGMTATVGWNLYKTKTKTVHSRMHFGFSFTENHRTSAQAQRTSLNAQVL